LHKSNVIYKGAIFVLQLYPFPYFEFALSLLMNDVGCSLAEPSIMSGVSFGFSMAAI
jgi:hypothetical protein